MVLPRLTFDQYYTDIEQEYQGTTKTTTFDWYYTDIEQEWYYQGYHFWSILYRYRTEMVLSGLRLLTNILQI